MGQQDSQHTGLSPPVSAMCVRFIRQGDQMVFWLWQMKKSNIQCDYNSVLLLQSKYNTADWSTGEGGPMSNTAMSSHPNSYW